MDIELSFILFLIYMSAVIAVVVYVMMPSKKKVARLLVLSTLRSDAETRRIVHIDENKQLYVYVNNNGVVGIDSYD